MSASVKHEFLTKLKERFAHNFTTQLDVQGNRGYLIKTALTFICSNLQKFRKKARN
jgi:hypothetical protein